MSDKEPKVIHTPISLSDFSAFSRLIRELRYENRFFLSDRSAEFIASIVAFAKQSKAHEIPTGTSFFRARKHELHDATEPYGLDEMGAPPKEKATHGRLNPVGIPYLYLASDVQTAVSEANPWIGCMLTVAKFTLPRPISVISFSRRTFPDPPSSFKDKTREFTWEQLIAMMFSIPFDPRDTTAYVPSQYLTERIKREGFDGVLYDSARKKGGQNLALFGPSIPKAIEPYQVTVTSVVYDYASTR